MAAACGETLSEVIRRALRCYVEQGYERTVRARHDGWFVQNRRCHYQLGLISTQDRSETWLAAIFVDLTLVV